MRYTRLQYSLHLIRAHLQGFPPCPNIRAFVRIAAHAAGPLSRSTGQQ